MRILEDDPIDPDCIERTLKACEGEPFFREHKGKRYCALHFPGPDKKDAFDIAFERKLDSHHSNYQGVWFPEGNWFGGLTIQTPLDFRNALFGGPVSFHKTTFNSDVNFGNATSRWAKAGVAAAQMRATAIIRVRERESTAISRTMERVDFGLVMSPSKVFAARRL